MRDNQDLRTKEEIERDFAARHGAHPLPEAVREAIKRLENDAGDSIGMGSFPETHEADLWILIKALKAQEAVSETKESLPEAVREQVKALYWSVAYKLDPDERVEFAAGLNRELEAAAQQKRARHDVEYPCGCSRDYCPTHQPSWVASPPPPTPEDP